MPEAEQSKIVVGVDGSEPSLVALQAAVDLARVLNGKLEVVTVWDFPTATGIPVPLPPEFNPAAIAAEVADAAVRKVLGSESEPAAEVKTVEGRPRVVLPAMSRDARMLVVGSNGHNRIEGALLGSVSESCVRHASCPVLVVPSPPDRS
ncbi:MAG TPA: universal stress protein [Frankiaceae bacterium]|nr:universal stress protein [Frankiaceae bacterium]